MRLDMLVETALRLVQFAALVAFVNLRRVVSINGVILEPVRVLVGFWTVRDWAVVRLLISTLSVSIYNNKFV